MLPALEEIVRLLELAEREGLGVSLLASMTNWTASSQICGRAWSGGLLSASSTPYPGTPRARSLPTRTRPLMAPPGPQRCPGSSLSYTSYHVSNVTHAPHNGSISHIRTHLSNNRPDRTRLECRDHHLHLLAITRKHAADTRGREEDGLCEVCALVGRAYGDFESPSSRTSRGMRFIVLM